MGIPLELKDQQMITFEEASAANLKGPHFTLGELAKEIGWRTGWNNMPAKKVLVVSGKEKPQSPAP